ADLGNDVVCVDNVAEKIATLQAGGMPIYEPGLEEMVARNVADGRLGFTTDLTDAVRRSVVVFITVGTPATDTGQTDLGAVEAVAREIGRAMERYTVVVNKSTVPVGTADITQVVKGMGLDPRIGPAFLQAGLGYGGSCFPKDTDSLVHTAAALGVDFVLLRAAVETNAERAGHFVRMIEKALAPLDDKRIAVLGLAFKANTDD